MFNPSANPGDRPFVMVIGLDLRDQDSSGYAFDQAMRIAARIERCETHVVYVMPEETTDEGLREGIKLTQLYVSDKAAALGVNAPRRAAIHVRCADPAHGIAQLASDVHADLIVVGTRPSHVSKLWVGSTAERVMASTPCPVFVAGPRPKPHPSHVITIEPPCPDCVQQRFVTQGRAWWCERHSQSHHLHRHHVYSYQVDFPFATHDSTVTSTGTD